MMSRPKSVGAKAAQYCVNENERSNGDHEVQVAGCPAEVAARAEFYRKVLET